MRRTVQTTTCCTFILVYICILLNFFETFSSSSIIFTHAFQKYQWKSCHYQSYSTMSYGCNDKKRKNDLSSIPMSSSGSGGCSSSSDSPSTSNGSSKMPLLMRLSFVPPTMQNNGMFWNKFMFSSRSIGGRYSSGNAPSDDNKKEGNYYQPRNEYNQLQRQSSRSALTASWRNSFHAPDAQPQPQPQQNGKISKEESIPSLHSKECKDDVVVSLPPTVKHPKRFHNMTSKEILRRRWRAMRIMKRVKERSLSWNFRKVDKNHLGGRRVDGHDDGNVVLLDDEEKPKEKQTKIKYMENNALDLVTNSTSTSTITSNYYNSSRNHISGIRNGIKGEKQKRENNGKKKNKEVENIIVTNVQQLREAVLDRGVELKSIEFQNVSFVPRNPPNQTQTSKRWSIASTPSAMKSKAKGNSPNRRSIAWDHPVLQLIEMRSKTNSKPGARAVNDTATLALSIEGGGMRGAVSAGMASAIAVLGLSDVFDCIYGSSAGSVVGAYMVSRQMCIDVYTDVLTTAKSKFVSKGRLASSLATNLIDTRVLNNTVVFSKYISPAMNISFVLDGIMCPMGGLRPLDLEKFRINDQRQPLRVVTSTVRQGKMETHCLGSQTMDFFDKIDNETGQVVERATTMMNSNKKDRHGFFACLETSMLVPAATGPPLPLLRNKDAHLNITTKCFDAFCYEPIPYRSAVEEGATHVLVLKTRPDGSPIGTKPGLFERVFAPMYFDSNGMPQVSKYFENGGQQYIYVEDYLTLDQGRDHKVNESDAQSLKGVPVPPPKILYGVERDEEAERLAKNRDGWKRAHLYPLAVAEGKPELSTLSVDQDEVLEGVSLGFAEAFDLLAPLANVELNSHLNGDRVAELLFSHVGTETNVLEVQVPVPGDLILESEEHCQVQNCNTCCTNTMEEKVARDLRSAYFMHELEILRESAQDPCPIRDASELLDSLPGFHRGRMMSLSKGLHRLKQNRD